MRFLLVAWVVAAGVLHAHADWRWRATFSERSSPRLASLHEQLLEPRLAEGGFPVQDVHWRDDDLDVHLLRGTVFLERPVDGVVFGAYFEGQATVTFTPQTRAARGDLEYRFGTTSIERMTTPRVLFFSLRDTSLLDDLGIEGSPSVTRESQKTYEKDKAALRQTGTKLLHAFLNRRSVSRNTALVMFAPPEIQTRGSREARLLYVLDPNAEKVVTLHAFGHAGVTPAEPWKHAFLPIAWAPSARQAFVPQARATLYSTALTSDLSKFGTTERTTITFTPADGLSSARLPLTARLQVQAVTDGDGRPLPFLQWQPVASGWPEDLDEHVIVQFPEPLDGSRESTITIVSSGALFEKILDTYVLMDEDQWCPRFDDPEGSLYETTLSIKGPMIAVAPGEKVSETMEGNERSYRFRTRHPRVRSTIYFGDYVTRSDVAGETEIEVYVDKSEPMAARNLEFATTEIANAIRVFNQILVPLDLDHLRVASILPSHGRGFEGLLLLSRAGGFALSGWFSKSDLFRAHEVAHQWWGGMVDSKFWPDDRWLTESFAEYIAMEYYRIRFEKQDAFVREMTTNWWHPVMMPGPESYETLTGRKVSRRASELHPVARGTGNVYTKGPLVVHMLRYLFRVQTGTDASFWDLLRDFLRENANRPVTSDQFRQFAETRLNMPLDWFWEQWIHGTTIPEVSWTAETIREGNEWKVVVDAEQKGSEFTLLIPVAVELSGGRVATRPLVLRGRTGRAELRLQEKPGKITLNTYLEALVRLDRR